MATYPVSPSGSVLSTTPSLILTRIGDPQSRHGQSIWTVFPG
jgi:hypothetical protein